MRIIMPSDIRFYAAMQFSSVGWVSVSVTQQNFGVSGYAPLTRPTKLKARLRKRRKCPETGFPPFAKGEQWGFQTESEMKKTVNPLIL